MNEQDQELKELHKRLEEIRIGEDLLKSNKQIIKIDISNRKEELRALVMQSSETQNLLEAQHLDSLEEQDWEDEQANIEEDYIQEIVRDIK